MIGTWRLCEVWGRIVSEALKSIFCMLGYKIISSGPRGGALLLERKWFWWFWMVWNNLSVVCGYYHRHNNSEFPTRLTCTKHVTCGISHAMAFSVTTRQLSELLDSNEPNPWSETRPTTGAHHDEVAAIVMVGVPNPDLGVAVGGQSRSSRSQVSGWF